MTSRRKNATIIISDSEEELATRGKTRKRKKKDDSDEEHKPLKSNTPKKTVKKRKKTAESDVEIVDEVKEESGVSADKTQSPVPKTTKKGTRKRKLEGPEMGGLLSKKRRTTETKVTLNQPIHKIASSAPPTVSPRRQLSPTFHEVPQTGGLKHDEPTPTVIRQKTDYVTEWNDVEYIQEHHQLQRSIAAVIVGLFQSDNTVPFIARYRRAATNGLDADELRLIKESYDRVKLIKHKADNVIKAIEKVGKWTPELHNTVKSIKSINELDHIHSLYKTTKKTLAERARELGLGPAAEAILQGGPIYLRSFLNISKEGLRNEEEIREGVVCIMADVISKDKRVFDKINDLRNEISIKMETKKVKSEKADKKNENKENKFDNYYDWSMPEKLIKPHHILAINRGEAKKILTVKLIIPDVFEARLKHYVLELYGQMMRSALHKELLHQSFALALKKSIKPSITRRARSEMNEKAENASMEVFAINVKQLLLTPPVRGKIVLGIDPGFTHGCKLAVVSPQGDVIETATIYPHKKSPNASKEAANTLSTIVRKHQCTVFAIGNATACRETEGFISDLIRSGIFSPVDVTYTIVDESGASIYSCNSEAKAEFPNLDYNVISAISIARRLQDPLAELVKIEPKHLGVGMYQHDLPEKQLMSKLNEVVTESVSFVGVDINTASQCLLRRVAGLSETKALNIIEWKKVNGPFINRSDLLKVKGIGPKSFEQCAGFIRVQPETASPGSSNFDRLKKKFNYLDQTWIHPESYSVATALVNDCHLDLKDIGSRQFISAINVYAGKGHKLLAQTFKTDETTIDIIVKGLTMAKDEDIRVHGNAPLFRKSLRSIDDLRVGSLLSGEIRNVTHFGAFVDVGVGKEGLLHISQMKGETLKIGQRLDVKVQSLDKSRGRIGLILIKSY